ncbi:MAG: hypothetical protein HYR80_09555 [Nitrospirae bacterium]|nr:hypothetical protein [Nitrospirota bacterium]
MENADKKHAYGELALKICNHYWNKPDRRFLPVLGAGPLNAKVMVIGINPNFVREKEDDYQKYDVPFLNDKTLNEEKILRYNAERMACLQSGKESEKFRNDYLNDNFEYLIKQINWSNPGSDPLSHALLRLFKNIFNQEEEDGNLKKMIRLGMYFTNVIKIPTTSEAELNQRYPGIWEEKEHQEFLMEEINIISPDVIWCLGAKVYERLQPKQWLGLTDRKASSNSPVEHYFKESENGSPKHIICTHHYARNRWVKKDFSELFKKVALSKDLDFENKLNSSVNDPLY